MTAEPDAARPEALPLREFDEFLRRTDDIALTIEDVVLLILHARPRPVKGLGRLTGEVLMALKEVLAGPDVEPAVFKGGPGGPRSAGVERALDSLAFSNSVRVSRGGGDGSNPGAMRFKIAPRGKARIKERWDALPASTRRTLAQKRAEWDAAAPAFLEGTYVHNAALLERISPDSQVGGRDGHRAAEGLPAPDAGPEAARRQEHMDRGDRLYEKGQYDEAYAAYTSAVGLGVPGADLHLKMALSLRELGLYEKALKRCRAAIKVDSARAEGYILMGHCLHRLGRHARALLYSRRAVRRSPSDPQPYTLCGVVLNSLGRHAEAMSYYQRAARLDPDNVQACQNAAFSLFRLGRYEEALRQSEKAAELLPEDPVAHARIVSCLSRMGRHEEAIPAGRRAVEAAPGLVNSYFPLITSLTGLGRHEEVLEWCSRAAKVDPRDPRPPFTMALSLRALRRHEEALSRCREAAELDPGNTDFHTVMSQILRDLGRLPEALSHCETVVSAKPDNLPVLSNMGSILADMGRHKEALACFDKAIRIDPRQPFPHYNRALSLQQADRPRKALRQYREVVKLDPGNIGAYNNMGIVLAGLGRDGEALAHFDRALKLGPGNAVVHCNKALSLQHLEQHREALAHFDRAFELDPGNADAYVGRVSCLADLGLPEDAIGRYAAETLGPVVAAPADAAPPAADAPGTAPPADAAPPAADAPGTAPPAAVPNSGRAQLVKSFLSKDESEVLEFKSWPGSHQGVSPKSSKMEEKIARELCGFVNTKGGDLLIGVGDDGKAEGLKPGGGRLSRRERDDMLVWVTNIIVDYFGAEHNGRFDREIVEVDGLDILHCAAAESDDGPVILKRRLEGKHDFFMRAGSTCRPLDSKGMLDYVKRKWPRWASPPRTMGQSIVRQESKLVDDVKDESIVISIDGS